jgi:hypothetical protein
VCFIGAPLCPLVSAVLARGVSVVIPLFFYAAEIAAAKMLLFFLESAPMDILTIRGLGKDHIVVHKPLAANPVLLAKRLHRPIQRRQVHPAQQR